MANKIYKITFKSALDVVYTFFLYDSGEIEIDSPKPKLTMTELSEKMTIIKLVSDFMGRTNKKKIVFEKI